MVSFCLIEYPNKKILIHMDTRRKNRTQNIRVSCRSPQYDDVHTTNRPRHVRTYNSVM